MYVWCGLGISGWCVWCLAVCVCVVIVAMCVVIVAVCVVMVAMCVVIVAMCVAGGSEYVRCPVYITLKDLCLVVVVDIRHIGTF